MIVAYWTPYNLSWTGATIATSGYWADTCEARLWNPHTSYGCSSHGTMTFTGSTATNLGGSMSMFGTRVYNYDPKLPLADSTMVPDGGRPLHRAHGARDSDLLSAHPLWVSPLI